MFEQYETGATLDKESFEAGLGELRLRLLNAQVDLREADFPVIVLLYGNDRVGLNQLLNRFNEWMDSRRMQTFVFEVPGGEEAERPSFWRYWKRLPARGNTGLYLGAWVRVLIERRLNGTYDDEEFTRRLEWARSFERTLVDDGALVLKFWLHLPEKPYRKWLKKASKRPDEFWRVDPADQALAEQWHDVIPVAERVLSATDDSRFPWQVVESTDRRYRDHRVFHAFADALERRLAERPTVPASLPIPEAPGAPNLATVDLTQSLPREEYREQRDELSRRLHRAQERARAAGITTVAAFEGWDAAGKGSAIRRLTRALEARDYRVVPVAAPTPEDAAHHYFWRFWRRLPRAGRILVFDRTWYGRVLVERVEGYATEPQWRRAYREIREFEEQLVDHGIVLCKFWIHIDAEEQLRRFHQREATPYKKYKITQEDYRNRDRWSDYTAAVDEAVSKTHTPAAPWTLVPGNDKRWARIHVLQTVATALEAAVSAEGG